MDRRLAEPDYKALFTQLPGPYLALDASLRILDATEAFLRTFSRDRGDLIGRYFTECFPPDATAAHARVTGQMRACLDEALQSRQSRSAIVVEARSGGPRAAAREWSLSTAPVLRDDGSVAYLIQRAEDVSGLARIEDPQPAQRWPMLQEVARDATLTGRVPIPADVEAAHVLLIMEDPAMNECVAQALGHRYWVSRAFGAREGLEKALLPDRPNLIIADAALPDMTATRMVDELRRHESLEDVPIVMMTAAAEDALRVQLLRQGVQDFLHKPFSREELLARVQSLLAKWQRAGQRLRQSEERYRTLFNSVEEGFCILEVLFDDSDKAADYIFIETNPSFERQTGLAGVQGKRARELGPDIEDRWLDIYGKVALTGEPVRFESHAAHLGRWFDTYAFRYGDREHRQVAVVLNDSTARRQTGQALQEADRRKDQFLALLAHELRNPLAPIRNAVHILRMSAAANTAPVSQLLPMMERQLAHMARLLDDLLDVSRVSNGMIELRKETIDVAQAVQAGVEASKPVIDSLGHQLSVWLPPEPVLVDADPVRLAQVVSNLLNNAANYSARGARIHLAARREGSELRLSVTDTGVGIREEDLDSIFGLFVQVGRPSARRQGGLGIGLSLVRSLVEMHGGRVEARSAGLGHGSEFIVRLPVLPPAPH
jgi:signal transduction histidine kinase/CheY-like chemotaxis protein